jgi:hypothetical protein
LLGGRSFIVLAPLSQAKRPFGEKPPSMSRELFRVDSALRKPIHLPRLAEETAGSAVLWAFALVIRHGPLVWRGGAFRPTDRA